VSGVTVGAGAVWVSPGYHPRSGEVVRIDPRTNEVVARVGARVYAGELAASAGAVWVLGHPDYTDETARGESLHRVDPGTNELVATPLRDERLLLGGHFVPPVLVAGRDACGSTRPGRLPSMGPWQSASTPDNEVTRRPLPADHFFPFAVTEGHVWFTSPGGDLAGLNVHTFEVEASLELRVNVGDATFDPANGSFWIAAVASVAEIGGPSSRSISASALPAGRVRLIAGPSGSGWRGCRAPAPAEA
jgi:hypothetical protein